MLIEKVLLVDDDPSIRVVAEICLSRVGNWQVTVAESGKQALEMAAREVPDLILLDVMMPGMDGPTTLQLLRKIYTGPVIFITAKTQKQEVERFINLGAAGVISKPFDPMALPSQIEAILEIYNHSSSYNGCSSHMADQLELLHSKAAV